MCLPEPGAIFTYYSINTSVLSRDGGKVALLVTQKMHVFARGSSQF